MSRVAGLNAGNTTLSNATFSNDSLLAASRSGGYDATASFIIYMINECGVRNYVREKFSERSSCRNSVFLY